MKSSLTLWRNKWDHSLLDMFGHVSIPCLRRGTSHRLLMGGRFFLLFLHSLSMLSSSPPSSLSSSPSSSLLACVSYTASHSSLPYKMTYPRQAPHNQMHCLHHTSLYMSGQFSSPCSGCHHYLQHNYHIQYQIQDCAQVWHCWHCLDVQLLRIAAAPSGMSTGSADGGDIKASYARQGSHPTSEHIDQIWQVGTGLLALVAFQAHHCPQQPYPPLIGITFDYVRVNEAKEIVSWGFITCTSAGQECSLFFLYPQRAGGPLVVAPSGSLDNAFHPQREAVVFFGPSACLSPYPAPWVVTSLPPFFWCTGMMSSVWF